MGAGNFNIKSLLLCLRDGLSGVCDNIFPTSRPNSDTMSEFIIISYPNRIQDNKAYGTTYCWIELYVKDLTGGVENLPAISALQDKVYSKLPISTGTYLISNPTIMALESDTVGFHYLSIRCNVLIV